MSQINENVQSLHSALRRRKDDSSIERSVAEYNFFTKKVKKNAKKLITSLKQMDRKFGVSLALNQDQDLAALIRVLREVIAMNMSIFQSLLSFLAFPSAKSKITKWLVVTNLMQKGVQSCEENSNELQSVDAALSTLLCDSTSVEKMQATRNNLEALENSIQSLENGLENIKENVQALHSAIRRRKGDSSIARSVAEYNSFTKKVKKNAKKLITSLKQMDSNFGVSPLLNQDQDLAALIRVLREVIAMNMSIFQSLLSFLAPPSSKSKITKWLMVAKLMQKGVQSCEENSNELQHVDAALITLLSDGTNVKNMQPARDNLEALENAIESLENGLENIFRFLIKTRASLLNIIAQ
ncbi:unnamed protein product [Lupinus luteus]|uniref:Uncharacterized protein n=1 Tax=Lupinus luteus TaxID=3873 RepID=A0AAV1WQ75_LUPLU